MVAGVGGSDKTRGAVVGCMAEEVNYREVEPVAESMHWLREPLDCSELGLTVVDAEAGWRGKEHDHGHDGQEEVYLLLEGEAELEVEDEVFDLGVGDAVRVDPGESRQMTVGDAGALVVVAGAP